MLVSAQRLSLALWLLGCSGAPEQPAAPDDTADDPPVAVVDPIHVPLRRLNHRQFERSVEDLTGIELDLTETLAVDYGQFGYGTSSLTTSELLAEQWWTAITEVSDALEPLVAWPTQRLEAESDLAAWAEDELQETSLTVGQWVVLWREDHELTLPFEVTAAGDHELHLKVLSWANTFNPVDTTFDVFLDGESLGVFQLFGSMNELDLVTIPVTLEQGAHTVVIHLINGADPSQTFESVRIGADSNPIVWVDHVEVVGPISARPPTPLDALIDCTTRDQACAESTLASFAEAAWRRPTTADELQRLMGIWSLATEDGSFEEGIQWAVTATLISPRFLFRIEDSEEETAALTDWEVASRLSLLLWGSVPDETLLACARAGDLLSSSPSDDTCTLAAQVERMLASPRSEAVVEDFLVPWLEADQVLAVEKDTERFPDFDPSLGASMLAETERVLRHHLDSRTPITELLSSPYTDVDAPLAELYGLDTPGSQTAPSHDGLGLLRHASVLTATSTPTRTSPVTRGQWVLDRLLCAPAPPPPPDVPSLEDGEDSGQNVATILASHRADPACASCHDAIDPIGLALESFDGMGRHRETYDNGETVLHREPLQDGTEIDDARDLARWITEHPDYGRCMATQLVRYAHGLDGPDAPELIERLVKTAAASDDSWSAMLEALTTDPTFQTYLPETTP